MDLSDWEPDDPVLAEIPGASSEFLESRRRLKQAGARSLLDDVQPSPAEDDIVMERASFQSDPDRFLKCLAILETALRLRQKQGIEQGQIPSTEDLMRLAMATLKALPIDLETNADFLVLFVSRSIGEARQSSELQEFQSELAASEPKELTGLKLREIARVDLPAETNETLDSVSEA